MLKPMEVRLVGRFRFCSRLSGQHDSMFYKAIHSQTNQMLVLKGEQVKGGRAKRGCLSLLQEGKLYQSMQGGIGIPYMHWCGQEEDYNFIVLEQLGSTLGSLQAQCGLHFSLKTALMVVSQLVESLQYYHFKYFVFNNICPHHVMTGSGQKSNKLYLIDYSRSIRYKDPQTQEHICQAERPTQAKVYNMEFSSINFQKGGTVSRRDDMESLLYLLAYMIKGSLPWSQEARSTQKNEYQRAKKVLEIKQSRGKSIFERHKPLQGLYAYTLALKYEQKPHYSLYTSTFAQLMESIDEIDDKIYDWMLLDDEEPEELTHRFELIDHQDDFLQRFGSQFAKGSDNSQESGFKPSEKSQRRSGKGDKECEIY